MSKPQLALNNLLLQVLSNEQLPDFFLHLELVAMPLGKVLHEPGSAIGFVYFPSDCIVSLLSVMRDGFSGEIAVVGKEGVVGVAAFMGGESAQSRAVVQSAGYAYRIAASYVTETFNQSDRFRSVLLRYTQALISQISQTAGCNRHHSIDQQLCRLLLLSLDRLPSNQIIMTQELIANMLGVRREGVTEAAGKLQRQGIIEYKRGHITVLRREALERLSCECYFVVKKEFDRLLPCKTS
ncbi:Crp/Fnr family transcriptional regulator [Aurantivibrio plasticivorans]